jgi:glycosyltransferase involved in cell wall biosynthesis
VESGPLEYWLSRAPATPHAGITTEGAVSRGFRAARTLLSPLASPEVYHYPPRGDLRHRLPKADVGIYHYSFSHVWLRRRSGPETRTVVHLQNLESELSRLRASTEHRSGKSPAALLHHLNASKLARHERALHRLADELWFVSRADLQEYSRLTGSSRLRLVPPTFDPALFDRRRESWEARWDAAAPILALGFLGSGSYAPNRSSLEWILDRLAPQLLSRGFPGRILVAGKDIPQDIRKRGSALGCVDFLGFVRDLQEFWNSLSFFLIPQVGGSGIRVKLLEALASGVPVLANGEAAAPLPQDLRASPLLFVSEEPSSWAKRIMDDTRPFQTRQLLRHVSMRGTSLDGDMLYRRLRERGATGACDAYESPLP